MKIVERYKKLSAAERQVILAVLGGIFGIIVALILIIPYLLPKPDADLRLVDSRIFQERIPAIDLEEKGYFTVPKPFPTIEFKLRNVGEKIAFVKEAKIKVYNVFKLIPQIRFKPVEVTWKYRVELSPKDTPYTKSLPISQEIAVNQTDRFIISFGQQPLYDHYSYIYNVMVELIYNESNRKLKTDNFIFLIPADNIFSFDQWEPPNPDVDHNLKILRNIKSLEGKKCSYVLKLLEELNQHKKKKNSFK
jgi:hypothetical protein